MNASTSLLYSNRDLRTLLVPLIFEQLLSAMMGIADTLMVSNVGEEALSGVSLVDAINNLILLLFSAMAAGGTIVCAQYLGRGDPKDARRAAGQVLLSCFALSLVPTALCVACYGPLLRLIYGSIAPGVMAAGKIYFLISALSYPFIALQQSAAALFRAEGDSRTPLMVSALANGVNVAGNAFLIFGLGLGVLGAALATLISRVLSAVVLLAMLRDESHKLRVTHYLALRPDWHIIRLVLRIGIPTGMEQGLFQLGKLIVASTVSTLGTSAISAQAMIQMVEGIHSYPSLAVGLGLTTVAGTCMGAGQVEQTRYYTKKLCWISEGLMVVMSLPTWFLLKPIAAVARLTPEGTELFINLMEILLLVKLVLWVLSFTLPNAMRAAGDVAFCATVSTVCMWLFRVVLTFLLCRYWNWGLYGVWFGWIVDWVVRLGFYVWRFHSGRWAEKTVLD